MAREKKNYHKSAALFSDECNSTAMIC